MHRSMRQRSRCIAALLLVLLASCACTLLLSRPALAEEVTAKGQIRFFQEYRVNVSGLQNTFDYEIVPTEVDAPSFVDSSGVVVKEFSLKRDQEIWFTIPVNAQVSPSAEQLVYHYKLQPKKAKLSNGLYYVDLLSTDLKAGVNVYYLELYIQLSSADAGAAIVTPIVHVEGWDGPKVTDPGWRIAYDEKAAEESKSSEETKKSSTSGSSSSRTSLSKTGDTYDATLVMSCVAYGTVLLLAGLLLRRRKAGEGNA